jgi:hypothetical protein
MEIKTVHNGKIVTVKAIELKTGMKHRFFIHRRGSDVCISEFTSGLPVVINKTISGASETFEMVLGNNSYDNIEDLIKLRIIDYLLTYPLNS